MTIQVFHVHFKLTVQLYTILENQFHLQVLRFVKTFIFRKATSQITDNSPTKYFSFSILSDVDHGDGGAGGSSRVGLQQVRGGAGVP